MSEGIDHKLNDAGMAFMVGDQVGSVVDPQSDELEAMTYKAERNIIITGKTDIDVVYRPSSDPALGDKGEMLAKCIGGMDYLIGPHKGKAKFVELKSIGSFLERDHGEDYPILNNDHGTLYVELYNDSGERPGWMIHYLKPDRDRTKKLDSLPDPAIEKKNSPAMIHAHDPATPAPERFPTYFPPHYLIYLLFADDDGTLPYAAISFEFDSFKKKLSDLTGEAVSEMYWVLPPEAALPDRAADILKPGSRGVCSLTEQGRRSHQWMEGRVIKAKGTGYCWHIPMDELADIARVTMIGDEAQIKKYFKARASKKKQLIDTRYQWLKDHSDGRRIDR